MFCRSCLTQWIDSSNGFTRKKPTCPACRQPISLGPHKNPSVVNLKFKLKARPPQAPSDAASHEPYIRQNA